MKPKYTPRGQLFSVQNPTADWVKVEALHITLGLHDGRILSVPIHWHPAIAAATPAQMSNCELLGGGTGIYWPDVDEALSVEGFLQGNSQVPVKG